MMLEPLEQVPYYKNVLNSSVMKILNNRQVSFLQGSANISISAYKMLIEKFWGIIK